MSIEKRIDIYWDIKNNIPVILDRNRITRKNKELKYLTFDLRPVFLEEKHLLKILIPEVDEDIYFKSVWANKQGRYFLDGEKIDAQLSKILSSTKNIDDIIQRIKGFKPTNEMYSAEKKFINDFVMANKTRYNELVYSTKKDKEGYSFGSEPFIRELIPKYSNRIVSVSFSGGKDSIVVSHLVRKALNSQEIIHIFGDTTLELPLTYEFVEKFKEKNPEIPFLEERNDENSFIDICEKIGPPSRVKSWCCSIFKTGPMGTTFAEIDENILMFYGIRRNESVSRSKYLRVTNSPKIKKQIVSSPIIDWFDIDIWLYIFTEKLDFNFAYRQGFSRIGCWCCPNNSRWSDFLSLVYINEEYSKWKNFLLEFSKNIGKKDYVEYVEEGKWKARQGGAGLDISKKIKIKSQECVTEDNSKNYVLFKEIDNEFFELLKPFGTLNFDLGNKKIGEVFILGNDNSITMKILAKKGRKKTRFTVINSKDRYIFSKIENQLRKFNTCIYCKACNSSCPFGAINVTNESYKIDEKLCVNCLKCISHFNTGCLISNSLVIKNQEEV